MSPLPNQEDQEPTPSSPRAAPPLRQLALQAAALLFVLTLAWPYFGTRGQPLPWPETALAIGASALLLATLSRQPWWWRLIHAIFVPLAWAVAQTSVDPGWFLLAFGLLLLVYRGALTGQIPLYLSNPETAEALADLAAGKPDLRFIDLGAGIGSVVRPLATRRPEARVTGVENAPATWLIGRLRTLGVANCEWRWGDLWHLDLSGYDVVYAFLSPVPMPELWQKVSREMPPGSLLVSNSFPVPGVEAECVIEVGDRRGTQLYCYRVRRTVPATA